MNLIDRIVASFDPVRGLRREQARRLLAYYEAGKPDRQRKQRRETGTANEAVLRAGRHIYQQARHLEQNYDLALGVLNALVNNVVGPQGILVEPQPRTLKDRTIDDDFAAELLELWNDWQCHPEVTRQYDWAGTQRLLARSWFRDGDVFAQLLSGNVRYLDHHTVVPLSLELIETDMVPLELNSDRPLIRQGVEVNAWGAPTGYHVLKGDPDEIGLSFLSAGQTKRIAAANMLHLANRHRIRQLRGVSVFAAVMHRFDDLKDYEESERVAAKIAASMAAFIRKGSPDLYEPGLNGAVRELQMRPGMIFDDLQMGEEIGTIDTTRPNVNLEAYRSGQLRAIAAGTGPTYSVVARTYDGTYSAQRQELIEGWNTYAVLSSEFVSRIIRPTYETFVRLAIAAGAVRVPKGLRESSIDDALFLAPQMPWIDPLKEANAWSVLEDHAYASGPEIVRRRGSSPLDVVSQQARWLRAKEKAGIPPPKGAAMSAIAPFDPDDRAAS